MRKNTTTPTGAAIRYGRDIAGLTRDELADQLGGDWTVTKIANYELGRTDPSLSQAAELAQLLNLPLGVIAYGLEWKQTNGRDVMLPEGQTDADLLTLDNTIGPIRVLAGSAA